jgi:outer membrane immunogenic protein
MRKLLLGSAFALAATAGAFAADMPVKAPPPVVAPVWSWTGFYVGANVGYSWGRWDSAHTPFITNLTNGPVVTPVVIDPLVTTSPTGNGWLGGVQAGYNWQADSRWVFGVEADVQVTGERGSRTYDPVRVRVSELPASGNVAGANFNDVITAIASSEWKFPWFATLRGRIGLLADPQMLLYATGGLAIGRFTYSTTSTVTVQRFVGATSDIPSAGPPRFGFLAGTAGFSDSTTSLGLAVGAGVERKLTKNWSVKFEYLYLDFGTHNYLAGTPFDTSIRFRDHIARVGLNYQFDWAAPAVVSKY